MAKRAAARSMKFTLNKYNKAKPAAKKANFPVWNVQPQRDFRGNLWSDRGKTKTNEGMGAAYMPDAKEKKTPAREITSKAVLKQLNRNRNRGAMKGKVRTPNVRYVHDRQRETDLTAAQRGKTVINPEEKKKGKGHRKKKGRKSKKK